MTKTLALLLDSYRELNAKRLFWIVLAISGVVVGGFAMIGVNGDTVTILWWDTPFKSDMLTYLEPTFLYKSMFTVFGVGVWLSWIGNILALVSTAGIFPDFMAEGAIDLYLSKPISRLRLFAIKYVGGLLFVTAQVTVFSVCSFVVLGLRGKLWAPGVFLAIPVVMLVFSYLFSICVLIGVLTRSTIAALLLTLVAWFVIWGVQTTEGLLLQQKLLSDYQAIALDQKIADTNIQLQHFSTSRPVNHADEPDSLRSLIPFGLFSQRQSKSDLAAKLEQLQTQRRELTKTMQKAHFVAYAAMTVLPKTQGTTQLLDRVLMTDADRKRKIDDAPRPDFSNGHRPGPSPRAFREREYLTRQANQIRERRSWAWVISTSVVFEMVIITLAGWLFCRRDY